MRDDAFNLAGFRSLSTVPTPPAAGRSSKPLAAPSLRPGLTPGSSPGLSSGLAAQTNPRSFTSELTRAMKPYASPMKRTTPQTTTTQSATRRPGATPLGKPTSTPPQPARPAASTTTTSRADRSKPTTPAAAPAEPHRVQDLSQLPGPLPLSAYPHPDRDNGRGMHWVPTTRQDNATVDRLVNEARRMGVKWVTFLNDGANIGNNDYLVSKLVGAGIEPVMRLYSPTLEPLQGDIEGMVRHYTAKGVHYFQPFNEPNLNVENPDGKVSVDRYLDAWVPAARAIVRGGGLPGFGSMAPGGDYDDQQFLTAALGGLKARGEVGVLDRAWLSMHNYTWNHPIEDRGDGDGFFKFRAYHKAVQAALGRDIPIIGTEGGTFVGQQEDPKMAAVTPGMATDWTRQAFTYMRDQRESWLFASSVWTIAALAGGGTDQRFEAQALIHADGSTNPIVGALQGLG
jgi:hypothetical protein